jgi:hypothetical protein
VPPDHSYGISIYLRPILLAGPTEPYKRHPPSSRPAKAGHPRLHFGAKPCPAIANEHDRLNPIHSFLIPKQAYIPTLTANDPQCPSTVMPTKVGIHVFSLLA